MFNLCLAATGRKLSERAFVGGVARYGRGRVATRAQRFLE